MAMQADGSFAPPLIAQALCKGQCMARKVRDLIRDLSEAGFVDRGGKGSHRNFVHPNLTKPVTISGNEGDDAKQYQEKAIRLAIEEAKK